MNKCRNVLIVILPLLFLVGCAFVGSKPIPPDNPPGFFLGLWHGLIAPYTLIFRLFMSIQMYTVPNSGWFYDCGFLIGVSGSIPLGWLAAIIALITHFCIV